MRPFRALVRPLSRRPFPAPTRALSASPGPLSSLLGPLGPFVDVLTSIATRAQQRGASLRDGETRGGDAGAQRTAILEAALAHVSAQGWTMDALAAGADTLGLVLARAAASARLWCPRAISKPNRPHTLAVSPQPRRVSFRTAPSSSCGT
jgi:hypothetical protein